MCMSPERDFLMFRIRELLYVSPEDGDMFNPCNLNDSGTLLSQDIRCQDLKRMAGGRLAYTEPKDSSFVLLDGQFEPIARLLPTALEKEQQGLINIGRADQRCYLWRADPDQLLVIDTQGLQYSRVHGLLSAGAVARAGLLGKEGRKLLLVSQVGGDCFLHYWQNSESYPANSRSVQSIDPDCILLLRSDNNREHPEHPQRGEGPCHCQLSLAEQRNHPIIHF